MESIFITLLVLGPCFMIAFYGVTLFNNLITMKHNVTKAWANIDVLLKQRHDELPKLVDVCKQYKEFEQSTLMQIVKARSNIETARSQQDVQALGQAERALAQGLGRLFAIAENYPELRSSEHFIQLQTRISVLENSIADRRELYNESANINNVAIEQFPAVILASLFNFKPAKLLEIPSSETVDVDIKGLFNGSN